MLTPMFIVYYCIVAFMTVLTLWNVFREKDVKNQAATALVLIPLLLRVFLVK